MHYKSLFFLFFLLGIFCVEAQEVSRINYPFTDSGTRLKLPMTGGMNAPQFSEVDYDNDGIMDLFVFDRAGDVMLTFRTVGNAYEFRSFYAKNFPEGLNNWVLLRDYDKDGVMDIFGYSDEPGVDGVIVYKGYYDDNEEIKFNRFNFNELTQNIIPLRLQNGTHSNLYVSFEDMPGIADMDGDGDLDILTFGIGGGYINLYTNQSVEMGYGLDSLKFELETNCWGYVYEGGLSEVIDTSAVLGDCPGNKPSGNIAIRHAGSTLCPMDIDSDGDKEVLIGDVSFSNLNLLVNGGSADDAHIMDQDTFWPSNTTSANIPIFPAAYHFDLDFDGIKDIIAAPNLPINAENYFNSWFFKNVGSNENKIFEFIQNDFLINQMIDHGSDAHPEYIDINQDGLLDLLVGTSSFFVPGGGRDPRIVYYQNIGTSTQPAFELVDDDFLDMSAFMTTSLTFAPTAGDLDGDGDLDLLIGEAFGGLFFAENTAGPGNPMTFAALEFSYFDIDVGQASSPVIVDLNRDGLLDLVVGERNGNVNYFQNTGSVTNPQFIADPKVAPNIEKLGDIDTREIGIGSGYSSPIVLDFATGYTILTGSRSGNVRIYNNIDGNLDGAFDLVTSEYGELVREGSNTNFTLADMDSDGIYEMMIGNSRGGISGFQTLFKIDGTLDAEDLDNNLGINVFPNPAINSITIQTQFAPENKTSYALYDTVGRELKNGNLYNQKEIVGLQDIPSGVYFLVVVAGEDNYIEKVVKNGER